MDMDAIDNLRVPFLGFLAGSVLFGVTLLQAYQYFWNYGQDSKGRKVTVSRLLDCLHFAFSSVLMYGSLTSAARYTNETVIWCAPAMAVAKTLLLIFVQSYYLYLIWILAENILIKRGLSRAIKSFSIITFLYAIGALLGFSVSPFLGQVVNIFSFSLSFEKMLYVAFGSTAAIDCGIAAVISVVLYNSSSASASFKGRGGGIVHDLILFFIGTGVLTAISAIITITLYASNPSSVLYLALEFSVPRIYANSLLALFNAKTRLKEKMDPSVDLRVSSFLIFGEAPASITPN
ncbi:hypothetical protein GALMADRAFT_229418 [Galerina marginata CBS 339.88]|uniref:DUF6534 domain-containing protein n=1 Tax=Galerina marginata (strain CBS 339.88) TaxID=685588 RepID=A0A067SPH4_GALM3|nr:hypothetical protein GALMADRAFT_229418 [Galerina marginata CBS 339.88]